MSVLKVHNSYTRQKEEFTPLTPGHVGMYVCGPTVSGESHLGHARPFITFDFIYRYLLHLGYKVRYVRNITDAGHFEEEGREAEDKIAKKAVVEKLEPMELVQKYTNLFHWAMRQFNNLEPSIEPTATGHIVEQIGMIETIIKEGYAYEVNGSVYFDVKKYAAKYPYGKLSGRILDDLLETTRDLDGQDEKRNRQDFALWKLAPPEHIMRWQSPWGEGFPGWHIECSAMSTKYLGEQFDIHGGGMDLQFPHHESEIAQSTICNKHIPARYWLHNNMITINGKKMGKSYNNQIRLTEMFSGNNPILQQAYSPMTIRFFILQTHYRSTLDFSNEALQAAEKGLKRLWEAYDLLKKMDIEGFSGNGVPGNGASGNGASGQGSHGHTSGPGSPGHPNSSGNTWPSNDAPDYGSPSTASDPALDDQVRKLLHGLDEYMNDDFNTAKVLANIFELVPVINSLKGGQIQRDAISPATLQLMKDYFTDYLEKILGLKGESLGDDHKLTGVVDLLIDIRRDARSRKDYATSDKIRNQLLELGIVLKDEKDGGVSYTFA
ncbi:MAG TPA: cysteine--tRNA ligase [Puia sp.]|jgi:cysteinyl-tRNA synthetase|nr:cysteine--tRNA ligase [Puia sp.]